MAFNAGEIIAYLKLNRDEFNAGLDEARADADAKFKEPIDVSVKPALDKTAAEEVLVEEEPLRKDIEPEVKPTYAKAEAEQVGKSIASDMLSGIGSESTSSGGGNGMSGLMKAFLGKGLNEQEMSSALKNLGFSRSEIESAMGSAITGGGGSDLSLARSISDVIKPAVDKGLNDVINAEADNNGKSGFLSNLISKIFAVNNKIFTPFQGAAGIIFGPMGAAAGTAFLGAFGAALGGVVAGTAIGGAGVFAALIPGYLAFMKGMAAYTALTTPGGSTKGMSTGAIGIGEQIKKLMGAGAQSFGSIEISIMPDISKFLGAFQKAMPTLEGFIKPAVKSMGGFFNMIDNAMNSKGFKSFMSSMDKLVGPTMNEFGQTMGNMAGAVGGFLKLFGPVGSKDIGPWFVKVSGQFDKFMNSIKFGPGFINGMKTVFGDLGSLMTALVPALKLFGNALAPIGIALANIAGSLGKIAKPILNKLAGSPGATDALTGVLSTVIAIKGIEMAKNLAVSFWTTFFADGAMTLGPEGVFLSIIASVSYPVIKNNHSPTVGPSWLHLPSQSFLSEWLSSAWTHAIQTVKFIGKAFLNLMVNNTNKVKIAVLPVLGSIAAWFQTKILGFFTGLPDKITSAAKGMWHGIADAFKDAINTIIGWWNQLHFHVPGFSIGPLHFGGFDLGMPAIPLLGSSAPQGVTGGGAPGHGADILHLKSGSPSPTPSVTISVDARGHANPQQVAQAVRTGIGATLPSLQAALARGAA